MAQISMAYDLPRFPAYHRHDRDIFPCFCTGLVFQKPVPFIQFHSFYPDCGYRFSSLGPNGLFLSNSLHWTCSFQEFFPHLDR